MYALRALKRGAALLGGIALGGYAAPAAALPERSTYDLVLGQPRLSTNRPGRTYGLGLFRPSGVAVDRTRRHLYLADFGNGRILAWRDIAQFHQGAQADLIIGQGDEFAGARLRSDDRALSFLGGGMFVDKDGTLWAADGNNGRVVGFRWPFAPSRGEVRIDFLIGQADFTAGYYDKACNGGFLFGGAAGPASAQSLCNPIGVTGDEAGNLWVADQNNSRVLYYPAPIPARGATATLVYGQADLVSSSCNRGGAAPTAATLCRPNAVLFSRETGAPAGGRLYVVDAGNSRVLAYDNPLTERSAARVFGQQSLTATGASNAPDRLRTPSGVLVTPAGEVFISDASQHRILGYDPPASGAGGFQPSYVLGQADLNGYSVNRSSGLLALVAPTAGALHNPVGAALDPSGKLLVADQNNNRVLTFTQYRQLGPAAVGVYGQPGFTRFAPNGSRVSGLVLPAGLALDRPDPQSRPGEPTHLYVSDFGNHRVLGYRDLALLVSGSPPDLILGQGDTEVCNQGRRSADADTLCWPRGLAVDARGDLFIADAWNHRVLRYPRPFAPGQAARADRVLGQADFTSSQPNRSGGSTPSELGLLNPAALAFGKDGALWVVDQDNDRLVAYAPPFESGMAASRVLIGPVEGAEPLRARGCPNPLPAGRQKGEYLCAPTGVAVDADGDLWVAERDNHRVVLYGSEAAAGQSAVPAAPKAILGQSAATAVAANGGGAISAAGLQLPHAVTVELGTDSGGRAVNVAIAVADTRNNRVLIYPPVKSGVGVAATRVLGQDGRFDQNPTNLDETHNDDPAGVERGLSSPIALLGTREGLFIAEAGREVSSTARVASPGSPAGLGGYGGNHRVVLIKGTGYPAPPPPPDLAAPDLAPGAPAPPDGGEGPAPSGGSCGCRVGGAPPAAGGPLWAGLLLIGLGRLSVHRSRSAEGRARRRVGRRAASR